METVKKYLRRYFIDAMGAMALGLFATVLSEFGDRGKKKSENKKEESEETVRIEENSQ